MMYLIVECLSAHTPSIDIDIAMSTEDNAGAGQCSEALSPTCIWDCIVSSCSMILELDGHSTFSLLFKFKCW